MSIQQAVAERRVGCFNVTASGIERDAATILAMLSGMIVIRCEHHAPSTLHLYTAIHPSFDPTRASDTPPQYTALPTHGPGEEPAFTWRRVSPPEVA